MITRLAEGDINTRYGLFQEVLYYDGRQESIAITMGDVAGQEDVLCRVHSSCIFGHHFNSIECDCREQMEISQQLIEREGRGIVIWLEQEGKGNGHYALLKSVAYKRQGYPQAEAYQAVGFPADARDFSPAAAILKDLGVQSVRMLTNNPKKMETLTQHGITVTGTMPTILEQ